MYIAGWTIFDQIYLFNGTWFLVTDKPSSIPLLRLMTSTGNEIWNDQESIKGRYVLGGHSFRAVYLIAHWVIMVFADAILTVNRQIRICG